VGKWCAIGAVLFAFVLAASAGTADALIKPLPLPRSGKSEVAFSVSCLDADYCWFAGFYEKTKVLKNVHQIAVAVGDTKAGLKAYALPSPTGAAGVFLDSISCWGPSGCRGVGAFMDLHGHPHALTASWNGQKWTDHPAPEPPGASQDYLTRVTCYKDDACLAVGAWIDARSNPHAMVLRWNGSSWRAQQVPSPAGAQNSSLSGVSCPQLGEFCEVTGTWVDAHGIAHSLAEQWTGGSWKLQQTSDPVASISGALNGVACESSKDCVGAGGWFDQHGTTHELADTWNGHAWTLSQLPTPRGIESASLNDASCFSANGCVAFGYWSKGPHQVFTLADRWNGSSWSIVPTANQAGPLGSGFADGVCLPGGACIAAGGSGTSGGGGRAFLETFRVK
jgi:hypothetical protein